MPDLKLIALDTEDLAVLSAHLQDAVLRVGDMVYLPAEKRFVAAANRFDWAESIAAAKASAGVTAGKVPPPQRRRTGLRFERVLSAKLHGINLNDKRATLALLAMTFEPATAEGPDGNVTLTFSGGAAIRLTVECLEAELKDLGAVWSAKRTPEHPEDKS